MKPSRGFSLVEVLVALMVIGIALPALLGQMQSQNDSQSSLRNKTLALYVVQNKMAEYQIAKHQGGGKFGSSESGEIEMAGARWYWRMTATDYPNFFGVNVQQVEVSAGLEPEEALSSVLAVFGE